MNLTPNTARAILERCTIDPETDFHALAVEHVANLLITADEYGYRKPKNANGSRGRYWYAYLQRRARLNPNT